MGDGHTRTGPSAGACTGPQGLPAPPNPIALIKQVHQNYRRSLCVLNSAGGVAILVLFCFSARRGGMLTLRGPSPRDSNYFVVPPEAKCSTQARSSAAGPGADVSSWEVSRASPCPTARLPAPLLLPTAPSPPRSWGSALLTAYTARCSLARGSPKSLLPHGVTAWGCSRHHPGLVPCQGRSPNNFNQGKRKVLHLGRDNARLQHMESQNHRITESQNALG